MYQMQFYEKFQMFLLSNNAQLAFLHLTNNSFIHAKLGFSKNSHCYVLFILYAAKKVIPKNSTHHLHTSSYPNLEKVTKVIGIERYSCKKPYNLLKQKYGMDWWIFLQYISFFTNIIWLLQSAHLQMESVILGNRWF